MGELISRHKHVFGGAAMMVFASLAVLIGFVTVSSAQSADITVDAGQYTIPDPDGTVEASIRIDPKDSGLAAVAVVVKYDKALVTPLTCIHVTGVGACNFEVEGEVRFDAVRAEGWPNPFNATKIEFQARGVTGTTPLTVTVPEAYDTDLGSLTGTGVNGSITITEGAPSAKLTSSCLQNNGMFKVSYDNPTAAAVTFRTTVSGLATRSEVVAANSVGLETVTGRPDGDYTVVVTADGTQILSSNETVNCDPPEQEVTLQNSCLASNGRIDVSLLNTNSSSQTYTVAVGSLSARTKTLAAGAGGRITVTGRPDGDLDVVVKRGSTTILNRSVTVDCDPNVEVVVKSTCLAQNGRIDTTMMNTTSAPHTYAVAVGNLAPRNRVLAAGESITVSVTGRPDGDLPVVVTRDGTQIYSTPETINCDGGTTPGEPVKVTVGCLAGNGRIDVNLGNTTTSSATFRVDVGDLDPRYRTLAANATDRVTVTGRPDGPIDVVVYRGNTEIYSQAQTVACG